MSHAADGVSPHVLFERRLGRDGVAGDALPASQSRSLPPVLPPSAACSGIRSPLTLPWPVKAATVVSLSPARQSAGESPRFYAFFSGPCTFNFVYGPDFCYISFDLI